MANGQTDKSDNKQDLFVSFYLSNGLNGTKAAIDAGYAPKAAHVAASQLLKNPKVAAKIKAECERILGDTDALKTEWLRHTKALAFSDYRKVGRFDKDGLELTTSEQMEDDAALAVESVEASVTMNKDGTKTVNRKVKLHSKKGALDTLGKFLGTLKDEVPQGVTIIINTDEAKLG